MRRLHFLLLCLMMAGNLLLGRQKPEKPKELAKPKQQSIEREFEIARGMQMKFCWIPPGKAMLGTPKDLSEKEQEYETEGFWLGKYEVTQEQWEAVMGNNPSRFKGLKLPVENVSWDNCQAFLGKCGVKGFKIKLPHENEWEYACRGGLGNKQEFYWGDSINEYLANCNGEYPPPVDRTISKGSLCRTTEVGHYEKRVLHPWGLCDMAGNVLEWCDNVFTNDDEFHSVRGGSWQWLPATCRSASLAGCSGHGDNIGFRVCLASE